MPGIVRQLLVILVYAVTLVVNSMASSGALGGTPTRDISNAYPILFVPANITFSIWGVIYLGLTVFVIFQALPAQRENPAVKRISGLFILSGLFNMVWLVLFQNFQFWASVPFMLGLLGSLIAIYLRLEIGKPASRSTFWFLQVPFSIYMGWITIATIANVAQAFYASGATELGLGGPVWAAIMLVIGTVIISAVILHGRGNIAYALTAIWAVAGIVMKQSETPLVAGTALAMIGVIVAVLVYSLWRRRKPETAPSLRTVRT
jgi:hypothetical protein